MKKHVGIHADRLSKKCNNPREVAFANKWHQEQQISHTLANLLGNTYSHRDAQVAATVIQWLGSNVGMSFLEEAIKSEPKLQEWFKKRF